MCVSVCVCVQESIGQFAEFAELVEAKALASMKEDIAYGDIPDRFKGQINTVISDDLVQLHNTSFLRIIIWLLQRIIFFCDF